MIHAAVPTYRDGVQGGQRLPLSSDDDVDAFVTLLSEDYADTANIQTEQAVLDAHIAHGFGYLAFVGDEGHLESVGNPDSPQVQSERGFPAGSGLELPVFTEAIREFVRTHRRPSTVRWASVKDSYGAPLY